MNEGNMGASREAVEGMDEREGSVGAEATTAGGVLAVRRGESGPRVAVLEAGGMVSLPRAEVGPGESAETAAHRAAQVFLGRRVRLVESIGETSDELDGASVVTWYWLAHERRGPQPLPTARPPAGFTLHWIDVEEALDALDSDAERDLVVDFARRRQPPRPHVFASGDHRALARDVESIRDATVAEAQVTEDPHQLEGLMQAREELERAEARLARGDDAGARRARARAERARLASLDEVGRAASLRSALARLTTEEREDLGVPIPGDGQPVPLTSLVAVHTAVDACLEQRSHAAAERRTAQLRATAAIGSTAVAFVLVAALGLLGSAGMNGSSTVGAGALALAHAAFGALGGWVGEALHALREPDDAHRAGIPLGAATGALAGLAVGALLTGGLASAAVGTGLGAGLAVAFASGWIARTALPR
ncbi:MAG: hypothetical protein AAGB93_15395 [Planctomycetota bacterium]